MTHQVHQVDVMIVGAGLVGLTLAAALSQKTNLKIALIDKQMLASNPENSHRVSAMALSSIRILQSLNAFQYLTQAQLSPYTQMSVWDGHSSGELHFNAKALACAALGYIIANEDMRCALEKTLAESDVKRFQPAVLKSFEHNENGVRCELTSGEQIKAQLAVAADGANSWLRQHAGISLKQNAENESALIGTITLNQAHEKTAKQIFLPTGPLACLPLRDPKAASFVWSLPEAQAATLLALPDEMFQAKLTQAFENRIGQVLSVKHREKFPLCPQEATTYVKPGLALVGDAAHTIHPLAGQGVNLGLLDAASLVDVLMSALDRGEDIGGYAVLRRYERWRRADNQPLLRGVALIKQQFSNVSPWQQVLRGKGMSWVDRCGLIKNQLARHAMGKRNDLPTLAAFNLT